VTAYFLISILLFGSCTAITTTKVPSSFPTERQPAEAVSLDQAILLVLADNQIHQSNASAIIAQSGFSDRFITEVTRRPVAQNLFGERIIDTVLDRHPGLPVLHLGDALDVSCTSEADRFFKLWAKDRQWVIAPGNHDGYFMGNFSPSDPGPKSGTITQTSWCLACQDRAMYGATPIAVAETLGQNKDWDGRCDWVTSGISKGRPMDRNSFLRRYLESRGVVLDASAGEIELRGGFPRRIAWQLIGDAPWKSYVTQWIEIDVSDNRGIDIVVLDTSALWTAPERPLVGPPAGINGSVSAQQAQIVKHWLSRRNSHNPIFFAGHHNWTQIEQASRQRIAKLMINSGAVAYLSAHSHEGWIRKHRISGLGQITEVNVGSVLDAPLHYRLLILRNKGDRDELALITQKIGVEWGELRHGSMPPLLCDSKWRLPAENPASPEDYASTGSLGWFLAAHRELDAELALLAEQWSLFPPKIEPSFCYVTDNSETMLGPMFSANEANKVIEHARTLIGRPKEDVTTRQKARLLAQMVRYSSLVHEPKKLEQWQLCQSLDAAWRDWWRTQSNTSHLSYYDDAFVVEIEKIR
jgi:hypothetical protein